jgi:hypothetical protein
MLRVTGYQNCCTAGKLCRFLQPRRLMNLCTTVFEVKFRSEISMLFVMLCTDYFG